MASAISMGNLGMSPLDMLNANMPAKTALSAASIFHDMKRRFTPGSSIATSASFAPPATRRDDCSGASTPRSTSLRARC